MKKESNINMKDLGYANGWHEDSLEKRLVEMTRRAGYEFKEEFLPPHTFKYTCLEAGLTYRTCCS